MPQYSRYVWIALCLVSLLINAGPVVAQSTTTDVTFSGPVQLPGVVLPAGSYQFALARDARSVVVFAADHRVVTTVVVIGITRALAGSLVTMRPSTDGAPPQVSALYSGGGTTGVEFVYGSTKK
jgi:hypothetical protein